MRGKFYEIVFSRHYQFFLILAVGFKLLCFVRVVVGLSVIIPFVGAAIVTVPVVIAAFLQFGFGTEFAWIVGTYFIIQIF